MIKLSRTGITTLKKQYKSVLLKCLLINAGILFAANNAMAVDFYVSATDGGATTKAITVGGGLNTGSSADGIYVNYDAATMNVGTDGKLTLSTAAQTSLGKADTAVQSANLADQSLTIDAASLSVNGAAVLTSHQAITTGSTAGTISVGGTDVAVKDVATLQTLTDSTTGVAKAQAAIADAAGNVITTTYATKTELTNERTATATLTGKTISADSNTISDLEVGNFKTGVVATAAVAAGAGSDTALATTSALGATRTAINTDIANAVSAVENKLDDGASGYDIDAKTLKVQGADVVTSIASGAAGYLKVNGTDVAITSFDAAGAAAAVQGSTTETVASVNAKVSTNATNIGNLGTLIGAGSAISDSGVLNGKTLSGSYTVQNALVDVDNAVATNKTNIATNTTNIGNLGTLIGAGSAISDSGVLNGKILSGSYTVQSALVDVDNAVATNTTNIGNLGTLIGAGSAISDNGVLNGKTLSGSYTVQSALVDIDNQVAANSSKIGAATLTTTATDLSGAVNELDAEMGNVSNLFSTGSGNIGRGDSVAAILSSVDTDLDAAVLKNTSQDTKLDSLATSIGGSYNASDAFVRNSYGTTLYTVSDSQSLTTAIGALDNALGSVATAKAAVAGASAATNMAAVVSQLSANLTNGTIDANFGNTTVDSLTIDGTSYGIKSTGAATFASTTTDSLKVGSAAAITGETANTLNMHDNSLTNVKDIASAALTTNSSAKTVSIGGTGYTTTVTGDEVVTGKLGVTGDFAVNTNKFTVAAATGNTSIAGTLGVTGATTLSDTLSVAGKTTLSSTNGLGFGTETAIVKSIDDGSAAKTTTSANNATTMATVATVLKSAENAVYTGTATKDKTGTAPATISAALDLIGDVKALTTSDNFTNAGAITVATVSDALQGIDATLGKIHGLANTSGTVTPSAGITSTVGSGTNLARGTTVEAHLVSLDNAIGNRTSGFATNKPVDYADTALNGKQDLVTVISQVASNIGVAADLTTAGTNGVAATNTVNKNIDTVNKNLGDVQTAIANSHYGTGAADLSEMVGKVDTKLYSLDRDVRKLKKEFKGGMASMAAMTALVPNARAHGNTQVSIGTGAYEGHTAAAIGGFHWINDNLLLNVGVSYGDTSKAAYRAGVTWSW